MAACEPRALGREARRVGFVNSAQHCGSAWPQAVLLQDPALPFVDTSPSNGLLSAAPYAKR